MRYFFLLLLIVASIGVFVAFIVPRYDVMQTTRAEVAADTANVATATQLEQSRESLIAQYNTIQKADLDNIKTLLPDSVDNIRLIIQMNSLATKNGLSSLRSVDYNPDQVPKTNTDGTPIVTPDNSGTPDPTSALPYGQFVITFQTSGQYSNFLAFLSDMEQNLRLVDVTDVVFTPIFDSNGVQTASSGLGYKVTLKTYWLKK